MNRIYLPSLAMIGLGLCALNAAAGPLQIPGTLLGTRPLSPTPLACPQGSGSPSVSLILTGSSYGNRNAKLNATLEIANRAGRVCAYTPGSSISALNLSSGLEEKWTLSSAVTTALLIPGRPLKAPVVIDFPANAAYASYILSGIANWSAGSQNRMRRRPAGRER